jgi:glyoxylase-like metal-dependent hydrolase (beta-lactamase superfamily II)
MPPPLNADNRASAASLDRLEALEADVLLPGHGEPWRGGVGVAVQRARSLAGLS